MKISPEICSFSAVIITVTFYCTICAAKVKHISKIVDLTAVTNFQGVDVYYRTVKDQKFGKPPKEPKKPAKRAKVKKTLCRNIFSSPYFEMRDEDVLNTDDLPIKLELLSRNNELFDTIFAGCENTSWLGGDEDDFDFEYVNNYEPLPVHLEDGDQTEFLFKCLVRERRTNEIKQYFVSEDYNVNFGDPFTSPIAGRFIFAYNQDKNLEIQALAEEPAVGSMFVKTKVAEMYYAKRRKFDGRTETTDIDPVCKLAPGNKLRLCVTIFSSVVVRDRFRFWPSILNVQLQCLRKRVSFLATESTSMRYLSKLIRASLDKDRIYDEWVIGCKVTPTAGTSSNVAEEEITYYVSRGDLKNTVFGYTHKFNDARLFVDSYFNNVSVVGGISEDLDFSYEEVDSETGSEASFASAQSSWSLH